MGAFDTILVANRGEIACRIFRTARRMGYRTAAIYSEADAGMPHVAQADASACVGPALATESYLNIPRVIAAAQALGAGAIHPGYGFLSENAAFAQACAQAGITFIGPSPEAIKQMGDKATAKRLMQAAGVPCIPGFDRPEASIEELVRAADQIGYPVMIKAVAGGGGKGMRLVTEPRDFAEALESCRSEAGKSFGNPVVMLEKAILEPRHVEVQVMGDRHGQVFNLSDRDCSVQRRHQKVLEEAPAPFLSDNLRARMSEAAIAAAKAVDYVGAGTVEFLVKGEEFYFLEMNTRLQVEHPVTEEVTGLDLVEQQIRAARGEALDLGALGPANGHAIEVRLYAEDSEGGFLPQAGRVERWEPAQGQGLRIDTGIAAGVTVSSNYDPMVAKIIAHGATRDEARRKLILAVQRTALCGPKTNHLFLLDVLRSDAFASGALTTALLDRLERANRSADRARLARIAAALLYHRASASHSAEMQGWHSRPWAAEEIELEIDAEPIKLMLSREATGAYRVADTLIEVIAADETSATLRFDGITRSLTLADTPEGLHLFDEGLTGSFAERRAQRGGSEAEGSTVAKAPMSAAVVAVRVAVGDTVTKGDTLGVLEAMKMEHRVVAAASGRVTAVHVVAGQQVASRQVLFEMEEDT